MVTARCLSHVCGDASRMAKDVEQTLLEIVMTHGNKILMPMIIL